MMRISSYPQQFDHSINIEIIAENEGHCIISLINQKGRIRMMAGVNLSQGINNIVVDKVETLENGLYHLQVKNTEAKIVYNTELVKQ
jgi:hypothetical protein